MKEKINLQELTALLSDKAGISKKDADAFLREFFGLMTESLIEDKIAKIRGLGTFKLTEVEARESVNVRTGERFLIAAHPKVSFNPDKKLSEIINKPYQHLVPEPVVKKTKSTGNRKITDKNPQTVQAKLIVKEPKTINKTPLERENISSTKKLHDDYFSAKENKITGFNELGEEDIRNRKKKIRIVAFTFLTVGVLIGFFYYYLREGSVGPYQSVPSTTIPFFIASTGNDTKNDSALNEKDTIAVIVNPTEEKVDSIKNTAASGKKRKTKVGERLTLISYEEYGDVVFWGYIYEENKHLISKDIYVKAGIEITIPPPEKYDINAKDSKSLQKARDFSNNL